MATIQTRIGDPIWEETFENQRWYVALGWSSKLLPTERSNFSNDAGNMRLPKEEVKLPAGANASEEWNWDGDWQLDLKRRNVDSEGWEYGFDFSSLTNGEGLPSRSIKHFARRRRWIRPRVLIRTVRRESAAPIARPAAGNRRSTHNRAAIQPPPPLRPGAEFDVGARAVSRDILAIQRHVQQIGELVSIDEASAENASMAQHKRRLEQLPEALSRCKQLIQNTASALSGAQVTERERGQLNKLRGDFQKVLQEFEKVAKVAQAQQKHLEAQARIAERKQKQQQIHGRNEPTGTREPSGPTPEQLQKMEEEKQLELEVNRTALLMEKRESDLREIAQEMSLVKDIFQDLATLVHSQDAQLNNIEANVNSAKVSSQDALRETKQAEEYQKKCLIM